MQIGNKLILSFGFANLTILGLAGVLIWSNHQLTTQREVVHHSFTQLVGIQHLYNDIHRQAKEASDYILFGESEREEYLEFAEKVEASIDEWEQNIKKDTANGIGNTNEELDQVATLRNNYKIFSRSIAKIFQRVKEGQSDLVADEFEMLIENHMENKIFGELGKAILIEQNEVSEVTNKANRLSADIKTITVFVVAVTLVFCLLILMALIKSIKQPIEKLKNAALEIGKGRFDTRIDIDSKDEIGILAQSFKKMIADLRATTVSKNYVNNIIKTMSNTLMIVNSDKRILDVNPATCDLLEYRKEELIDLPLKAVFPKELYGLKEGENLDLIKNGDLTFKVNFSYFQKR